jgi:transcription elongation factor Elf1
MAAGCGSPTTSSQTMATSRLINSDLDKLRTCPECGSSSFVEVVVNHEDPTAG